MPARITEVTSQHQTIDQIQSFSKKSVVLSTPLVPDIGTNISPLKMPLEEVPVYSKKEAAPISVHSSLRFCASWGVAHGKQEQGNNQQ